MAMDIERLATAVALRLDGTVTHWPEYERREVTREQVLIVPSGIAYKFLSRAHTQADYHLDVGVLRRATEDDIPALLKRVETLAKGLTGAVFEGFRCIEVKHEPLYSLEYLREKRLFVGILKLTFRGA